MFSLVLPKKEITEFPSVQISTGSILGKDLEYSRKREFSCNWTFEECIVSDTAQSGEPGEKPQN